VIKRQPFLQITIVLILFMLIVAGCSTPYKSVNLVSSDLFREKSKTAVNSESPSWETMQTLRLMFLDKDYRKNPTQIISKFEDMVKKEPMPELRIALAELSLLEAQKCKKSNPQQAIIYYLLAAQQSYDYLFFDTKSASSSPLTPSFRLMADIYNLAVADIIQMRAGKADRWESNDFDYEGIRYHYEVVKEGQGIWDPAIFDYLYNSYEIRVTGLANEYTTKGLGAPLVGIVNKPSEKAGFGQFFPIRLAAYPVSAVLLFDPIQKTDPPSRNIRLIFYNSLDTDSIKIQDRTVPLEADFTTPLGLQLRKTNPFQTGLRNLIKSDIELKNAGLYMLEPYQPDKIPVVMVHGLMSSPATWAGMFNDLRGDPELRNRYQFWLFMYPTGLPIGYSTTILREQLNAVHAKYDPNSTNPNFNQMVLVGHSMGGLISRGMVQDSGTKYWDHYFKEPFDTVDLDPNLKQTLKSMMFFDHLPYVKRVIFIATPHRGSPMADQWYTKILSGMVSLPTAISDTTETVVSKGALLTPSAASSFTRKSPNSLMLLSPSSVFVQATNKVPLRQDIPYHSIIGTRKRATVGAGTSDGIVPYESSHLDFAKSEILVPYGHSAHEHPLAIAEVKRILHEHLNSIKERE
jgi:pimeloyl-ACP methyl ester carboxylesterase